MKIEVKVRAADITQMVRQGGIAGLDETLLKIERYAKTKAPMRKVYPDRRYRTEWRNIGRPTTGRWKTVARKSEIRGEGKEAENWVQVRVSRDNEYRTSMRARREWGEAGPTYPNDRGPNAGKPAFWLRWNSRDWDFTELAGSPRYKPLITPGLGRNVSGIGYFGPRLRTSVANSWAKYVGQFEREHDRRDPTFNRNDRNQLSPIIPVSLARPGTAEAAYGVEDAEGRLRTKNQMGKPMRLGADYALQFGGRLRKEIWAYGAEPKGRHVQGYVISPTPYAKYVEYGTRKHGAAQPYMRPAFQQYKRDFVESIAKAMGQLDEG